MKLNVQYVDTPLGPCPLYWRDEQSGKLAAAINAYLDHGIDPKKPAPTQEQIDMVVAYCDYWVNAPCWKGEGLANLREAIKHVNTVGGLATWLYAALDEGIDPL